MYDGYSFVKLNKDQPEDFSQVVEYTGEQSLCYGCEFFKSHYLTLSFYDKQLSVLKLSKDTPNSN